MQFFRAVQFDSQRFVSTSGPLHGIPHSLFAREMTRCRSHKPTQVGSFHSPHCANTQSRGWQVVLHALTGGQLLASSWVPTHWVESSVLSNR
jgi:hypothetical protein